MYIFPSTHLPVRGLPLSCISEAGLYSTAMPHFCATASAAVLFASLLVFTPTGEVVSPVTENMSCPSITESFISCVTGTACIVRADGSRPGRVMSSTFTPHFFPYLFMKRGSMSS